MSTEPKVTYPHDSILFRQLTSQDAQAFREHARGTHVPGEPIRCVFHPVWRAEAEAIDQEAGLESTYSD